MESEELYCSAFVEENHRDKQNPRQSLFTRPFYKVSIYPIEKVKLIYFLLLFVTQLRNQLHVGRGEFLDVRESFFNSFFFEQFILIIG